MMARPRFDMATTALLDGLQHPLREEMDLLRSIVLSVDPSIVEGVKWNTASFRTTEWFATLNGPKHVNKPMIILHTGAKSPGIMMKDRIPDPAGSIRWLGNDRALINFKDKEDIKANEKVLRTIVRNWIQIR